jgi:hypothetical protein
MYPETFYAHLIAMLEIMVGMFGLAVVTGLIFRALFSSDGADAFQN